MSFIIMGRTCDDMELRGSDIDYPTEEAAYADISLAEENWPDATFWVEELRDMSFYMSHHQELHDNDERDIY